MLALTFAGLYFNDIRNQGSLAKELEHIPRVIDGWTAAGRDIELPGNILEALKATSYLQRTYERDGTQLSFFVAYYAEQRGGDNIHTPKHCLPGGGWEFSEMGTVPVSQGSTPVVVNNFVVQRGKERLRILYWYHSKSRVVANEYAAKFYLARDAIVKGATDGAIVKITVREQGSALPNALSFAQRALPEVQRCFGEETSSLAALY
jgi:EpsI family protein